jgi:four helix bundle protein
MNAELAGGLVDLKTRTKAFALRIVRLYSALPQSAVARVIGKQLLRSGTSVGAHYREATRSRSDAEFISKLEVAAQELEESAYWLELLAESGVMNPERLNDLQSEVKELSAIFITCAKNTKRRKAEGERPYKSLLRTGPGG